jgi:hypothetical protein
MKHAWILVMLLACGKSGEQQAREDMEKEQAKMAAEAPPPAPEKKRPDLPAEKPKPPPEPEPTTPAEIDMARKKAMIEGRVDDSIKYCDMLKLDDKSDPQVLLGCTLAACRKNDVDRAKTWSKPLEKAFLTEAKKVCLANKVTI